MHEHTRVDIPSTVTLKEQVATLPAASLARRTTVLSPTGKRPPEGMLLANVTVAGVGVPAAGSSATTTGQEYGA